ncbi:UDP-N-acetylglucosamine 2-epimerase [Sporohalobacter salinus]|uniref:UDP-N-acetylglucosamine 2-epimerase n=1 Tax=Sporohalobacter salinus TaxID=1494606 RepID=UPI001961EFC7|nr:UDP-N-acetylglucosamine 2-epimerase [Sporohalobacter salinus]MBM7622973.1 GDP/UDP-N,N'-diacetylbacillosamine 2-epimerase (hydrolyzing) [Sporohalobacter salinus]
MTSPKVCVVTGTRAEYGILRPLMGKLEDSKELDLQLIVTGMHLSPEFGLTYKEIEEDGFKIDEKIEVLMSSDTHIGVSKSMGMTLISFSEAYERLQPDMIVILGDRYETFSAMTAATVANIPVAHLHGGEITEGAFDDSFRHSMTKMSYLHFTSTEEYRKRVIQLGESPQRVFNVGAMGVENALNLDLLSKQEVEDKLEIDLGEEYIVIVFHPVTLENNAAKSQIRELLSALDENDDLVKMFIKGNSDTEGRIINQEIDEYVQQNNNSYAFTSLPIEYYLSLIKNSKALVGNSSSGIIEAPSFKIATINIGDRQKGRVKAESVIDCSPKKKDIREALGLINSKEFQTKLKYIDNPYGKGNASKKVIKTIEEFLLDKKIDLKKKFYDIELE